MLRFSFEISHLSFFNALFGACIYSTWMAKSCWKAAFNVLIIKIRPIFLFDDFQSIRTRDEFFLYALCVVAAFEWANVKAK